MDWSKAKSILIYVFVLVNLFLTVFIGTIYFKKDISEETIDNAIIALKSRGIIVNCEISRYNREIGTLSYLPFSYDRQMILKELLDSSDSDVENEEYIKDGRVVKFKNENLLIFKDTNGVNHIKLDTENDIKREVKNFLDKLGIKFKGYIIEYDEQASHLIVYEKYKNFCIFNNYVDFVINNDDVTIEVSYKKIMGINNKRQIMPAHQVLLKNLVDDKDLQIVSMILGFKEHILDEGVRELDDIPVWRVATGDNRQIFYKAYTGKELK